jgi:hypothetical protein
MSQVLTRGPAIRHGENTVDWHAKRAGADPTGPTLGDVVARAWEVLGTELPAACPVCGGELIPHPPTGGGRCGSCGSTLS